MSRSIRFPLLRPVPSVGPAEPDLTIEIFDGTVELPQAGANYVSVEAWKTLLRNTESPYTCFAVEFTATAAMIIGDGTFAQQIGLYGAIVNLDGSFNRTLLGVLGIARGGVAPQIPIVQHAASGDLVGYTQMCSDLSLYDFMSVGGVAGDIPIAGGESVIVTVRPIRTREYLG